MTLKEYYNSLDFKERIKFKNKILSILDINRYVFYRWLNHKTKVPKYAQFVISAIVGLPIDFECKDKNNFN